MPKPATKTGKLYGNLFRILNHIIQLLKLNNIKPAAIPSIVNLQILVISQFGLTAALFRSIPLKVWRVRTVPAKLKLKQFSTQMPLFKFTLKFLTLPGIDKRKWILSGHMVTLLTSPSTPSCDIISVISSLLFLTSRRNYWTSKRKTKS